MDSGTIITYWLCPAAPDYAYLAQLIRDLAARFDAPVFEPHVTLSVTSNQKENPRAVLNQVLPAHHAMRLTHSGLSYSDEFTKTLFIQLGDNKELNRLSDDLRRASVTEDDYRLNPHLSLLYKTLDEETKSELADSIRLDIADIQFDSVRAVISPAKIQDHSDIEAWRVLAEQKLTK